MELVKNGKVWAPKYVDLAMRPCPQPPTKLMLVEALYNECGSQGLICLVFDPQHMPDKEWLLVSLSTLNANHAFFQKNYSYIPDRRRVNLKQAEEDEEYLPNEDGFFDGLPPSRFHHVKRQL